MTATNPIAPWVLMQTGMDTVCIELKFTDGSMIAIDTIAVENEVADNVYQRSELAYLIYKSTMTG